MFGVNVIGSLLTISWVIYNARDERRELEDRLMALTNPESLILHKAQEDKVEASVTYIDDERRENGT